jgi:hypothetical protein
MAVAYLDGNDLLELSMKNRMYISFEGLSNSRSPLFLLDFLAGEHISRNECVHIYRSRKVRARVITSRAHV